jgi:DNA-binding transcriptional MerR regulator
MSKYSVNQLSKIAGVSVRTLHHYDQIGLLKPAYRSEKNYRYYEKKQLLTLQQILFYKELEIPLKEIQKIINDPGFDLIQALEGHKTALENRAERLDKLLNTIDKTLNYLKNDKYILTDDEIYEGFSEEQVKSMREEVGERWGKEQLLETEERIRKMGKEGWHDLQQKGEEISLLLADLMDLPPGHEKVQEAIQLHFRHMNNFYEVSKERYLGLGNMYTTDERFTEYYEKYRPGLADFINESIKIFCETLN